MKDVNISVQIGDVMVAIVWFLYHILLFSDVMTSITIFKSTIFYLCITLLHMGYILYDAISSRNHKLNFFHVICALVKLNYLIVVISLSNQ